MLNFNFLTFHSIVLLLILFILNVSSEENQQPCLVPERSEIEEHLSTKTPYRVIANLDEKPYVYEGCRPARIWSVIRHGSRYPSKEIIDQARTDLVEIREDILEQTDTKLCDDELNLLRTWHFNISGDEEKYLVAEGEDELIELAERMQKRFPDLLQKDYHPDFFYFKYTKTQRTLKSAQHFAVGLFGRDRINEIIYPEALHKDPVLRFYKLCNRWQNDVDDNPKTFDNARKFLDGHEMQKAIDYIKFKTQLHEISPQEAQLIYTICAFETAWQRRHAPSVWCNLFNRDTIKIMEFAEDLEYYWNDGYGYELTHKIACPAIGDMFEYIDPQSSKPNATFYFTHSGTLLKVLAHLGLYNDSAPLTHKDFEKQRLWRTSQIDAFATNVAFVLYECENSEPMVLVLHQERPVRLPGCPQDSDLCSLSQLRKVFVNSVESCDFHEYCGLPKQSSETE